MFLEPNFFEQYWMNVAQQQRLEQEASRFCLEVLLKLQDGMDYDNQEIEVTIAEDYFVVDVPYPEDKWVTYHIDKNGMIITIIIEDEPPVGEDDGEDEEE